jgi:hypothetical protein
MMPAQVHRPRRDPTLGEQALILLEVPRPAKDAVHAKNFAGDDGRRRRLDTQIAN